MKKHKINDFPNYYIREDGQVKNNKTGNVLKPGITNSGYYSVRLSNSGVCKNYFVHRLVAKYFCSGYEEGLEVNHKDGDRLNNHYSNLEWCTRSQNRKHSFRIGMDSQKHDKNNASKLSINDVDQIRSVLSWNWFTQKEIAESYNVDQSMISRIKNNHSWI